MKNAIEEDMVMAGGLSEATDSRSPDAESDADKSAAAQSPEPQEQTVRPGRRLSISIGIRGLVLGVVITGLVAAAATFGWLYFDSRRELDATTRASANDAHAEKVALDYAVNAAAMSYQDLNSWKVKLVAGTSPELNDKLTKAATSMEQILVPMQWTSTAKPLTAKVRSVNNGVYVVDCFVAVQTKTIQAPEALQSTATYSVTLDSNNNWQITDVGGIGAVTGAK